MNNLELELNLPDSIDAWLIEHRTELANATTIFGTTLSLYAAYDLSKGIGKQSWRGFGASATAAICDKVDGVISGYGKGTEEKSEEIAQQKSVPTIDSLSELIREFGKNNDKETDVLGYLQRIDGAWLDERLDKVGQWARHIAACRNRQIGKKALLLVFGRDVVVSTARSTVYRKYAAENEEGIIIENLARAGRAGKIKTGAMNVVFLALHSRLLQEKPAIGKRLIDLTTAMSLESGVKSIFDKEKALQTHKNYTGVRNKNDFSVAMSGLRRTARSLAVNSAQIIKRQT